MKLEIKAACGCTLGTIGCLLWYLSFRQPYGGETGDLHAFYESTFRCFGSTCLFVSGFFTYPPGEWTRPRQFSLPKWDAQAFFSGMRVILGIILILILFFQLPPDKGVALIGRWYFIGTFWLFALSTYARRYVEEKRKTQSTHVAAPETQRDTNP